MKELGYIVHALICRDVLLQHPMSLSGTFFRHVGGHHLGPSIILGFCGLIVSYNRFLIMLNISQNV